MSACARQYGHGVTPILECKSRRAVSKDRIASKMVASALAGSAAVLSAVVAVVALTNASWINVRDCNMRFLFRLRC